MALHRVGRDRIERGVSEHVNFKHGNVRGAWRDSAFPGRRIGQLPADVEIPAGSAYVVYSYATPIAWWTEHNGWTVPDVKYSVTTTNHQSAVRVAIAQSVGAA